MATLEWIEWGPGFARKREVVGIARILSGEKCPEFQGTKTGQIGGQVSPRAIGRHEVAARFMEVMEWADHETTDGRVIGATPELIDELAGVPGFAHALNRVGWLMQVPGGIEFVNFQYHNGKSSKTRKQAALKKKMQRLGESDVPNLSPKSRDKNGTEPGTTVPYRTNSSSPRKPTHSRAYTPQFTEAWQAYPTRGRTEKPAAFAEWGRAVAGLASERGTDVPEACAYLTDRVKAFGASPKGRRNQYVPAFAVWLKKGRWGDDPSAWEDDRPLAGLPKSPKAAPNPHRYAGQFPEEKINVPVS